jgi:hypothetical protein
MKPGQGNEQTESGRGGVIDLAQRMRARAEKTARSQGKPKPVAFSLFLLVSRSPELRDHGLFYVFLEGAPTRIAAAAFAREHASLFGSDIAIIDLHEHFENALEVIEMARHFSETAPGATVLAPDLGLGPLLARSG